MARYIDAEKLVEHKSPNVKTLYMQGWNDAIDAIIGNEPTADVMPVVHAYWKYRHVCSHCGYDDGWFRRYKICPNCGARMDAKEMNNEQV